MNQFFLAICLLLSLCPLAHARILKAGHLWDAPVYETKALDRKFKVVGKVTVQASQQGDLVKVMQDAASKYGGDAVIAYRVVDYGQMPGVVSGSTSPAQVQTGGAISGSGGTALSVGGFTLPTAEGIVVKFDKDGIEAIGETTVIPVLK